MTHNFCSARTSSGRPCKHAPMNGQRVCYVHGGASPQAKAKAAERLAQARAHKYLEAMGADQVPHRDSVEALRDIGNQASLLVDLLRGVIARLDTVSSDGGVGVGEQIRGEVQAYLQAMTRAESVHGRIIGLNLEERRTRVEEKDACLIATAFEAAFALAEGLTNRDVVVGELRRRLELLDENEWSTSRSNVQQQLPAPR